MKIKFKTTSKALKDGCSAIIDVGYCDLQNLLKYRSPVAYNSGRDGWNYDVYDVGNGVAIATGYRGTPHKNSHPDYNTTREYDKLAEGKTREERDKLIQEYVAKCVDEKYR
jgi:hypothetical protein